MATYHISKGNDFCASYSIDSDNGYPEHIHIDYNKEHPHWEMSLCHEWAHLLLVITGKHPKSVWKNDGLQTPLSVIKQELMAWRLAKSFCNPEYWSEEHALWDLTFCKLPTKGLRIIEYQPRLTKSTNCGII